jgi:glycosyltransferase involved in cell wall biosynthesis
MPPLVEGDYISAIGGNARDYATLMSAAEQLPEVPLVVVARPRNLRGLRIPPNVRTFTDIPFPDAMSVLANSRFMVLPLTGTDVRCGHVTLVAAMHFAKPFIITNSTGVADYVDHGETAIACPAFDPKGLCEAIRELWDDPERCLAMGENGKAFAGLNCSESSARRHLASLLASRGLL